jgi:hypothetical protein
MMEKLDKFAIKVYNWIIINILASIVYLIIIIAYPFVDAEDKKLPSLDDIKDDIKRFGGLKDGD